MGDSDPFVQRMLARTRARKNVMERVGQANKENTTQCTIEKDCESKIDVPPVSPLKNKKRTNLDEVLSPEKCVPLAQTASDSSILSTVSQPSYSLSPQKTSFSSNTSSCSNRFQQLSQRSKQMQEWEDDYTYHSVCGVSKKVESGYSGFNVQKPKPASSKLHEVKKSNFSPIKSPSPNKYYFGQTSESACKQKSNSGTVGKIKSETTVVSPKFANNKLKNTVASSCSNYDSPSECNLQISPIKKINSPHRENSSSSSSPRRLAWDRQLMNSLELQGFTPSESRSRLMYDFPRNKLPSESTVKSSATSKECQSEQPPKIISFHAKSPSCSPQKKRQNRREISPAKEPRERDLSPSKVNNLKNRWEEQIRSASPDRQLLNRSPSPIKKFQHSHSPSKTNSPTPISKFEAQGTNSNFKPTPQTSENIPQTGFQHGADFRRSLRTFDRLKPSSSIVKGETPMPSVIPVVEDGSGLSVRQKAAAFTSVMAPKIPTKDPAELSVQDRLNIFEKKRGAVLVPKAPFGQPVSAKVLQSNQESSLVNAAQNLPRQKQPQKANCKSETRKPVSKSSFEEQRQMFENVDDDWQSNDINSQVVSQRRSEMDTLLNRFKRPRGQSSIAVELRHEEESESEYPETDEESSIESRDSQLSGPPKPPRSFTASPTHSFIPPPPPQMNQMHSPFKRMNSTELGETNSPSPSPSKDYIPKVKPGCLFPSLSDIESNSEQTDCHESQDEDETKNSSFAESVLTCASVDSLGKHIQRVAQPINPHENTLSTIREGGESSSRYSRTPYMSETGNFRTPCMSESVEEAIGAIDDALDEAFSDHNDTTPPKRSRPDYHSDSHFKTPKVSKDSSTSSENSSDISLAHSISMYRKQKPAEVHYTPVRQIVRKTDLSSISSNSPISPSVNISHRIKELQAEGELQLKVISQASSAISVVSQRPEQHATPQHVEAEKLLLVATQKRQAALNEVQRLKAEGALGKRSYWSEDEDSCRGSISITNIALPLKPDFLNKSVNGSETTAHHILVLVKHRDQVITSQLQTTPSCIIEGAVSFPNLMALHDLSADFNISLEVYCFKIEPCQPANLKKEQSRMKLTPLKRLHKESRSAVSSPAIQSPAGPYSVRAPSFALVGFAHLNINTLTRNAWTLEKVPFNSPLDGHLLMRVSVSMEGGVAEKNFLTMFEDVGGFGAWNRRWCSLNGPYLRYWNYPDDENKKDCLGYLDLRMCTTRKVELISRDICARQYTFQLVLMRPARKSDKTDLVSEVKDNMVISRVLLSADSKEERILWCNKLNRSLANIRAWDPDALRPEDFHV